MSKESIRIRQVARMLQDTKEEVKESRLLIPILVAILIAPFVFNILSSFNPTEANPADHFGRNCIYLDDNNQPYFKRCQGDM